MGRRLTSSVGRLTVLREVGVVRSQDAWSDRSSSLIAVDLELASSAQSLVFRIVLDGGTIFHRI